MDNLGSRETLKLLKISDDSNKNNSDLDLPEITNQRKRKVRRKHRTNSRSNSQSAHHSTSSDFHGAKISTSQRKQCSSVLILWFIFIVIVWLLTVSYMLAIINSENSRLQVQIKKLESANVAQNLPEVLQNWHETSKFLQDNQTQIQTQILEYHKEIENLTRNLNQLKLDSSKAFTKEDFAAFGAEVKSASADVEQLKTRLSDLTTDQKKFTNELQTLTDKLNTSLNKISNSSENGYNVEALNSLESKLQLNYQSLNKTIQSFITTGEQKIKDVNELFNNNSKTLDDLKDKSESMKSHVQSMEKDWPYIRDSTFSHNITIMALKANIDEIRNTTKVIDSSISELIKEVNKIKLDKDKENPLDFLKDTGDQSINKGIKVPSSVTTSTTKTAVTTTTSSPMLLKNVTSKLNGTGGM